MTPEEQANLETIRTYLAAVESGKADALLRSIFTEDIRQIELPNRLNPSGQQSDLAGMLQRSEQGRKVLRSQRY
jgi:ketosteroid isomerase-like protein